MHGTTSVSVSHLGAKLCERCSCLRLDDSEEYLSALPDSNPGYMGVNSSYHISDVLPDLPALRQSAKDAGCGVCDFFANVIQQEVMWQRPGESEVNLSADYLWGPTPLDKTKRGLLKLLLKVAVMGTPNGSPLERSISINAVASGGMNHMVLQAPITPSSNAICLTLGPMAATWLNLERPPNEDPICPSNIAFIQEAIEDCGRNCPHLPKSHFIPTRLIDLGLTANEDPRLIITASALTGSTEPVRYAALSYPWGNKAEAETQTKTLPCNISERLTAIPTTEMSPIMQDAVKVCRALSIRYLWIDALCITQTDRTDWERESENMGLVYRYSHVTIMAAAAKSCQEHFLARHHIKVELGFSSLFNPGRQGTYTLAYYGPRIASLVAPEPLVMSQPLDVTELNGEELTLMARGWVFQERELSSRRLIFGRVMIHFECPTWRISENGFAQKYDTPRSFSGVLTEPSRYQDQYHIFRDMVDRYCCLALTNENDL